MCAQAKLLPATLTQQSAASRATRDGRDRQHWRLVIAGGGTVSQSGAAQAASLHFSARLLPARAKQLLAARRAMRRSRSAAPPTVPASGAGWPRHWEAPSDERGGSSRLAALLCPAAAGKGQAAVGCEASDATIAIGCAADSAGVWCWLAAALAPSDERGGSSRLASLLHSAAAGVGDGVTPWAVS